MSAERLDLIKTVLSQSTEPMSCDEIAAKLGFVLPFGPMPWHSIQEQIEQAVASGDSEILKTYPGVYIARKNASTAEIKDA